MKNLPILLICFIILIVVSPVCACAEVLNPWGVGTNYGAINHFKMFNDAITDAGSILSVNYSYDFNDRYTAMLEVGYIADDYVFPVSSSPRYVETASFINIDHIFYLNKSDNFSPYFKFGTGIYTVTLFKKQDNLFTFSASNTMADFDAGIGADFSVLGLTMNADLTLPSLAYEAYMNTGISYIFTIGYRHRF